jgi:hypothetical protein
LEKLAKFLAKFLIEEGLEAYATLRGDAEGSATFRFGITTDIFVVGIGRNFETFREGMREECEASKPFEQLGGTGGVAA